MAKSKEELISMIENDLVDPSTNKITGERVKNALTEMVDAMGTGGGSGAMEYWEAGDATIPLTTALYCPFIKVIIEEATQILPGSMIYSDPSAPILAVAFDRTYRFVVNGEMITMDDLLTELEWDDSNFIQITEEEFYSV